MEPCVTASIELPAAAAIAVATLTAETPLAPDVIRSPDAVVTDSVVLRAADSAGAPAALPQALPRGAEVSVIEQRSPWTKVRVASGTAGWVPDGAIQRVR